ncbi:MAG: enoyl-CoA hydratase [Alphaproteobacteria bacterium]|nr:enoyl-CoA hydratase [Alphaproteobacteria bacterium]
MTYETLLFDVSDGLAKITLNRPGAANSLNGEMAQDLMMASIRCDEDPDIRAVLLTGTGKMFCAGGDLKTFHTFGADTGARLKEITLYLHGAISRFARMDPPLVVAVNGIAAGAGLSIAVSGDLVLAARSAMFTSAYTAAGLSPDGSSTYFVPRLIGLRRAQELMLTNRRLSAEEAVEWGLINRVVDDEDLAEEAEKLARDLANGPTRAFGAVKTMLTETFTNPLETQMEIEARMISAMATSRDGKEGIDAFVNKRKADFTGE